MMRFHLFTILLRFLLHRREAAHIIMMLRASSQNLTPYERKKYVWKLLYIYMLGYDVDFGHMEAVALISAPKYAEKQVTNGAVLQEAMLIVASLEPLR